MPPETVAALIEAAERHWGFASGIEITLEANPSSVEAARFADLARAGVNRVSLGLQALDEEALHFLGRAHGLDEGLAALDTWAAELSRALSFGTGHLSLYQLTIEAGTRFAALHAKGELPETDPDHGAQLYDLTRALTEAAGLPAYEISNHARPGEESRHNLAYWRYQPYLGVGPGAHGRRGGLATQRHKKPENWLKALARNGHGMVEETSLLPNDQALERLLMGLRLREGVALADVAPVLDQAGLARMEQQGLVTRQDDRLQVAPTGMLLLDAILAEVAKPS
jgi:oxygen-independent coproporphyrinogen-3 oxidase